MGSSGAATAADCLGPRPKSTPSIAGGRPSASTSSLLRVSASAWSHEGERDAAVVVPDAVARLAPRPRGLGPARALTCGRPSRWVRGWLRGRRMGGRRRLAALRWLSSSRPCPAGRSAGTPAPVSASGSRPGPRRLAGRMAIPRRRSSSLATSRRITGSAGLRHRCPGALGRSGAGRRGGGRRRGDDAGDRRRRHVGRLVALHRPGDAPDRRLPESRTDAWTRPNDAARTTPPGPRPRTRHDHAVGARAVHRTPVPRRPEPRPLARGRRPPPALVDGRHRGDRSRERRRRRGVAPGHCASTRNAAIALASLDEGMLVHNARSHRRPGRGDNRVTVTLRPHVNFSLLGIFMGGEHFDVEVRPRSPGRAAVAPLPRRVGEAG